MSQVISHELFARVRLTVTQKRAGLLDSNDSFEECSTLAYRIALGVLRQPQDAEDVAQEALLKAHRALPSLRQPDRFRAWLVRLTFRLALDLKRSQKRRNRYEEAVGLETETRSLSVEEQAVRDDLSERIGRAVDALPPKLRLPTLLVAIEGHGVAEAARLLELPEGTVKSRLHRARKILAERLRCLVNDF